MDDVSERDALAAVRRYHAASTHRPEGYAPGPGFLDWDSQPDPFRRFAGAEPIPLPLVEGAGRRSYDALYDPGPGPAAEAEAEAEALGLFLELALGLSAWKSMGPARWPLRSNPSSGNLHPTEGYLLLWRPAGETLAPGLYHYAPHEHALERRARLSAEAAARIAATAPGTFGALGLSSILWREEWKYGARAYRYCQHDVGHALAAARLAAGACGWRLRLDPAPGDGTVAACLGLDRAADFDGAEPEHPDLLAVLGPEAAGAAPDWAEIAEALEDWSGAANRLSAESVRWPEIAAVLPAARKPEGAAAPPPPRAEAAEAPAAPPRPLDARRVIRQRRSAQRMDGWTGIALADLQRLLSRTLPRAGAAPFDAFPFPPALNLLLFLHRVEGLEPGLYAFIRAPERLEAFRAALGDRPFAPVGDGALPLYALDAPADLRKTASQLCCYQGLGGRGAFSLGMIADFEATLAAEGGWAYRRLHWEAGMIGQILYLEAEAAGLRGTGIGCFFDEAVAAAAGLGAGPRAPWRTLYHFAIGAALDDPRLTTEPPYAHLGRPPRPGEPRR